MVKKCGQERRLSEFYMRRAEWIWAAHLLTACNLFLGFWAIVQVVEGNYTTACWLIVIASICDGLDGKLARFAKGASEIGTELDSLVDIVSFGAAPSILLYFTSFHKLGFAGIILSSLPLFFGVVRLARFNINAASEDSESYLGLPIPMQADAIATFFVFNFALWGHLQLEFLLIPLTLILALLMVSQVRYDRLPRLSFRDTSRNLLKLIVICAGILLLALNPSVIFFPLVLIYVFKGLAASLFGLRPTAGKLEEVLKDETSI